MKTRFMRGTLTVNNIVAAVDEDPDLVIDEIQFLLDENNLDIPEEFGSVEDVKRTIALQAYFSNQSAYLLGLWGALKKATKRADHERIAMRDYLEKALSVCGRKYEGASRVLTGFQEINEEKGPRRF